MHTLYPSKALWTRYLVSSNTCSCGVSAPKTVSNVYDRFFRSSFHGCSTVNSSGIWSATFCFSFVSFPVSGRVRAYTRIFPFMSSI
eukprot:31056-Pelagococcus_subviridis.AAC.2